MNNAFFKGFMIFTIIFMVIVVVASIGFQIYLCKTYLSMPAEEVPTWVWFFLFWAK